MFTYFHPVINFQLEPLFAGKKGVSFLYFFMFHFAEPGNLELLMNIKSNVYVGNTAVMVISLL